MNINRLILAACIAMTSVASLSAARKTKTINDNWSFSLSGSGKVETVNLPHTWNSDAYTLKSFHKGIGSYTRTLKLTPEELEGRILLTVDGANKYAEVLVNGQLAATHKGGYTSFTTDITPYCTAGSSNVIRIDVDNSRQDVLPYSGDFTFFGGIYRDVWLISLPRQHFSIDDMSGRGIYVDIPEISQAQANFRVRSKLRNDNNKRASLRLEHKLYDASGKLAASFSRNITINANSDSEITTPMQTVKSPALWSPESPSLYRLESQLTDKATGEILDRMTMSVGFRWYSFDTDKGFMLNGKPYKLNGVCRHQDQQPVGYALTDEMHRRDMKLIKDMGANFVRLAHYPQDAAVLEQCDRLGLMVWEEIPIIDILPDIDGYIESCTQSLKEMIRQHYNHPSVILWGYMNEVMLLTYGQYRGDEFNRITSNTVNLAHRLDSIVKQEDPYRLSTIAFHSTNIYNETGFGEITDVIGWNLYQGWYSQNLTDFEAYIDDQHKRYPHQKLMISEYGAGSDKRLHSLNPKAFDFSMEYQQLYLEHYLPEIAKRDYIAGHSYWNFIDFGSAQRDESMPRINNKGLVFADRTPKDLYFYFKAMLRSGIPVLHIATRDWTNRTGVQHDSQPVVQPVKVYTNLPETEMFIDGISLGSKKTDNCHAIYDVPFTQGTHQLRITGTAGNRAHEDNIAVNFDAIPFHIGDSMKEIAINVGSECFYTDPLSNLTWVPDQPYSPGSWGYVGNNSTQRLTRTEIKGTANGPLFQSSRNDFDAYRFDLPAGTYEVELSFADTFQKEKLLPYLLAGSANGESNENLFDLCISGQIVEQALSPCAEAGDFRALTQRYIVTHADSTLEISLKPINGHTFLNAIKVRRID